MDRPEALTEARKLYEGEYGNIFVIAEKLSMRTSLTSARARQLVREAVVGYIADLILDYGEAR